MTERYVRKFNERESIDEDKFKKMKPYHDKAVQALEDFYKHGKDVYGENNAGKDIIRYVFEVLKAGLPPKIIKELVD